MDNFKEIKLGNFKMLHLCLIMYLIPHMIDQHIVEE